MSMDSLRDFSCSTDSACSCMAELLLNLLMTVVVKRGVCRELGRRDTVLYFAILNIN